MSKGNPTKPSILGSDLSLNQRVRVTHGEGAFDARVRSISRPVNGVDPNALEYYVTPEQPTSAAAREIVERFSFTRDQLQPIE